MWLIPLAGLVLGVLLGMLFHFSIPAVYVQYLSLGVLAALDSLLGGLRGYMEDRFDGAIMLSGFLCNGILAIALAYLGDRLGVDLYLAAVIAFGLRIFNNLGTIRTELISKYRARKKAAAEKDGEGD